MERIRKLSLKKAGIISTGVGAINIVLHLLLMLNILPYTWVSGGMVQSFEQAYQISRMTIAITFITMLIKLLASEIIPLKLNRFGRIVLSIFLIINIPFDFLMVIGQLLGTIFEKCFTSILTIILLLADFRLAVEKRIE